MSANRATAKARAFAELHRRNPHLAERVLRGEISLAQALHDLQEEAATRSAPTLPRCPARAAFNRGSIPIVEAIRDIFTRFAPPLTVRQVFYQLAAKDVLVPLSQAGYRKAQLLCLKVREEGIIPWEHFADRTRRRIQPSQWANLEDFGETVRGAYRKDLWISQPDHVEVWLEKQALEGFFKVALDPYGVSLYVIRGYGSATFIHEAAETLAGISKPKFLYYFGDHDASGVDLERDLIARLRRFGADGDDVTFRRVAVHLSDVATYGLRPFGAKASDVRTAGYRRTHGDVTIELDALPPDVIRQRLEQCVESHIDASEWNAMRGVEATEKETVRKVFGNFAAAGGAA